jgi:hypothetical protein
MFPISVRSSSGLMHFAQDGSRTNPSSPSMPTSIPARRGLQRTSISNGSQAGTIRSQSQPARGMNNLGYPIPYLVDAAGRPMFTGFMSQDMPLRYTPGYPTGTLTSDVPKEYVGYYMNQNLPPLHQQQQQQQFQNFALPQIPSYTELASRRNKVGQDLQPLNVDGHRRLSRSPSPLGHMRTYSTPLRSAPLPATPNATYPRNDSVLPTEYPRQPGGLLIVNGSGSGYPRTELPDAAFAAFELTGLPPQPLDTPCDEAGLKNPLEDALPMGPVVHEPRDYSDENVSEAEPLPELYAHEMNGISQDAATHDQDAQSVSDDNRTKPFPPFAAPIVSSSIQRSADADDAIFSPKSVPPKPWNAPAPAKPHRPALDMNAAAAHVSKQSEPKTAPPRAGPVLSPVRETRTPSPTVQRRPDFGQRQSLNGIAGLANGVSSKETVKANGKSALSRSKNEPVPPTPAPLLEKTLSQSSADSDKIDNRAASANVTGPAQSKAGQWETKTGKKKRLGKSNKKKGGASQSRTAPETSGQAIPANEADRKGG